MTSGEDWLNASRKWDERQGTSSNSAQIRRARLGLMVQSPTTFSELLQFVGQPSSIQEKERSPDGPTAGGLP
jgi:hypothetical protein